MIAGLLAAGAAYGLGARRLPGRRIWGRSRIGSAAGFLGGLAAIALALLSPLDDLGATLFSAHMVQHLVLILGAAPLLVYGAPLTIWSLALRGRAARTAHEVKRGPLLRGAALALGSPLVAWLLHVAGLWVWHVPSLYQLALRNEIVHVLEHATFLGTALLFWAVVLDGSRAARARRGVKALFVFITALQSSALGAILTFAPVALYPIHAAGAAAWGLTVLEDQQLAGVVMWVPAGAVYLVVMAVLLVRWLRGMEERMASLESEGRESERAPFPVGVGRR